MEINEKKRRYKRGYKLEESKAIADTVDRLHSTCVVCSVSWAVAYLLSIFAAIGITAWAVSFFNFAFGIAAYLILLVFVARQQRGLENMVHDGSHGSWFRQDRRKNDVLVNLFAATPVCMNVQGYWRFHRVHHAHFGAETDPCRRRFQEMGLAAIDLSTRTKIALAVLRWLPSYMLKYYSEIGAAGAAQWIKLVTWHLVVFVAPAAFTLAALGGHGIPAACLQATALWVFGWIVPAAIVLPVLRSIAEAEEHDYENASTEFGATFSNVGAMHKLILHPWNDAYHLIHHMYPSMPLRVHHRFHRMLMKVDPAYRGSMFRRKVLRE